MHSLQGNLRALHKAACVAYPSPHRFRHGHVMHALAHAKTPGDWKAIGQNEMHSGLGTTNEIYEILKDDEIAGQISKMGGSAAPAAGAMSQGQILAQNQTLIAQLQGVG